MKSMLLSIYLYLLPLLALFGRTNGFTAGGRIFGNVGVASTKKMMLKNRGDPSASASRISDYRPRAATPLLYASSEMESSSSQSRSHHAIDNVLAKLTNAFPLFVLGSAILGVAAPATLAWVNQGSLISIMLAAVMMGTGMTLEKRDFQTVLGEQFASVPAGVLCQFGIMPLAAYLVGTAVLLKSSPVHGPALFLGLVLVGCAPGGTASNLVSLIAGANVALSVLLTACSTILASVMTPLLVKLLVGSTVSISGWALCQATAQVVLLPVVLGMMLNAQVPQLSKELSRATPFASVVLVSLICGGVVAQNVAALGTTSATLWPKIVGSVLMLHSIGFIAGYIIPKKVLGFSEQTARTISIETGMQNSALAVVLARSLGAPALASLPGALSATVHSCLGSMLAAYWRLKARKGEGISPKMR
jgi:bile acid:Na+ symporter, BASS family